MQHEGSKLVAVKLFLALPDNVDFGMLTSGRYQLTAAICQSHNLSNWFHSTGMVLGEGDDGLSGSKLFPFWVIQELKTRFQLL